jgi:hypothetical protein
MRVYGRISDGNGGLKWEEVDTDANGFNDAVYVTAFCQVLLLNLNESPFYATFGIPQQQSVLQQVFPDYYVSLMQQIYSQFFASLLVQKVAGTTTPTYNVAIVTNQGATISAQVAVPT